MNASAVSSTRRYMCIRQVAETLENKKYKTGDKVQRNSPPSKKAMEKAKLRNLLGKRSSGIQKKKLNRGFKDAILKLIDQNQDLDGVLEELKEDDQPEGPANLKDSDQKQEDTDPQERSHHSVDSILNLMRDQSSTSGIPLSVLSARKCSQILVQMIQSTAETHGSEQKSVFWPVNQMGKLEVILETIKHVSHNLASFDRALFLDQIKKVPLPLELIWLLHKQSTVTFDLFVKANLGPGETFKKLTKDLLSIMLTDFSAAKEDLCQHIISDLIGFLITNAYPMGDSTPGSSHERALQEAYQLLLETIFSEHLKVRWMPLNDAFEGMSLLSDAYNDKHICIYDQCENSQEGRQLFLHVSWFKGSVPESSLKQLLKIQLSRFLSHKPVWTVSEAITQQGEWCSAKTDAIITQLFKEFTFEMGIQEIVEILKRTLEEEEVNWKVTLMFASFLLVNSSDIKADFIELLDYFLKEAFESLEQESLIAAFLLARQAASEGTHLFMSYENWFKVTFCQSNSQMFTNKKEVMFFLSFLNNLVPFESAEYLKAHIQHASFIPSKFRVHLDDYISLAKTRLQDLGVPWDATGIFKPKQDEAASSSKVQVKNPIEVDISRAVLAFEEKGKIPPAVIQAIMFRRKYFHTYFLPALLKPRMLPDIPDSKMKFILALNEANKIPAEMYQEYEIKCGQMLNDLLEGAFTEEAMEEVQEPMDALKGDMEKLANIVKSGWTGDDLRRQLSVISDGLKTMLVNVNTMSAQEVVDLEQAVMDKYVAEVVDVLLAGFCGIASTSEVKEGQRSFQWLGPFVTMLGGHSALHTMLLQKMWSSVADKEGCSSKEEIGDCTSLFVGIQICQDMYPKVKTSRMDVVYSILEVAAEKISVSKREGMVAALRFLTGILECSLNVSSSSDVHLHDIVPSPVVHKFLYLLERFKNCEKHRRDRLIGDEKFEEILHVYRSEKFKMLVTSKGKAKLDQWVKWELQVVPHWDILYDCERHNYHHLALMGDFLPGLEKECTKSGLTVYWKAMNIIVNALMDHSRGQHLCVKEDKSEMTYSSQREIVQLLAEILSMLPAEQQGSQTIKHQLISIFDERCEEVKGGLDSELIPSVMAAEIDSFVRLLLTLPPPFILTNHITHTPNESLLSHLAKFLEENRRHLMVNSFHLPHLLTAHIFKGLSILSSSSESWELDTALTNMMTLCPLLKISFMVHWYKLKPFTLMGSKPSVTLQQFEAVHQWIENTTSGSESSSTSLKTTPSEDGLLLSACLLVKIHQKQIHLTDRMFNYLCTSPSHEVFQALAEVFICEIGWKLLQGEYSQYFKYLIEITKMDYTGVLPLFAGQSTFRRRVCHPSSESIYSVVFFKLFERDDSSLWSENQMLPSSALLTTALECHIKFRDLYLLCGPLTPSRTLGHTDQILSVELLAACNNTMLRLINLSLPADIQNLPDTVVQRSSPEVQSYLRIKGKQLAS